MTSKLMRKIIVPLVTPPRADDFLPLIEHVAQGGVQDLVLFGTTGEGEKIDLPTKKSIIHQIILHIKDLHFYIGLMCRNITEAIELTNFCHELGFAGALLPPHLYGDDPKQVISEFIEKTSSKFIAYNPPKANPLGSIIHLFDETRIIGLKDSSGDIALLQELTNPVRKSTCKIYYGREYLLDEALKLDIDGIFPGTGNINPQLLIRLCRNMDNESFSLFNQLKEQIRLSAPESYVRGLKIVLKNLGIIRE